MTEVTTTQQIVNLPAVSPFTLIERAMDKGVDVTTLEKLIELQERTEDKNARRAFAQAIANAKNDFGKIGKSGTVNHGQGKTSFKHETMADIEGAVKSALSRYGLSYRFNTDQTDKITVTCIIEHKDGHREENRLSGAPDSSGAKNSIQAIGSTISYLQRYTLKAALGLSASEIEDDGAAAGGAISITAEQFVQIRNLAAEKGVPETAICSYYKIASLEHMRAIDFDAAIAKLKATGEQK